MAKEIGIRVPDVRVDYWAHNRDIVFNKQTQINLKTTFQTYKVPDNSGFGFQIPVMINYYNEGDLEKSVIQCIVVTDYVLVGIEDNVNPDIPDETLITLLSVAITHARSLLLMQAKNSNLFGLDFPLVDPRKIFEQMKIK